MLGLLLSLALSLSTIKKEPHTIRVQIKVDPLTYKMRVEISDTGFESYYRSAEENTVEGRQMYWMFFRDVPSGHYIITVSTVDTDGSQHTVPVQEFYIG